MRKILTIIILSLVLLLSCTTKNDDHDKAQINDLFYRIKDAFLQRDIDKLMTFYHPDAMHDGNATIFFRSQWHTRLTIYNDLTINIIDIEIDDNYAQASLVLTFYRNPTLTEIVPVNELRYLHYNGKWQIYGNQVPYGE